MAFTFLVCVNTSQVLAQSQAADHDKAQPTSNRSTSSTSSANPKDTASDLESIEGRLKALEQVIERQQREIQTLRDLLESRNQEAASHNANVAAATTHQPAAPVAISTAGQPTTNVATNHPPNISTTAATQSEATQKKVDELYKKFGAIRFSGDLRFRTETFANQGFDNLVESPDRIRHRIRARLALDGSLNPHFDWGLRLASGTFTDPISTNQTLTDFFERKPFALERAFVRYDSKSDSVGVQLIGGKFEPTFRRTQMVWDDDVNVEGLSEALYFKTKTALNQVKLVAFQLPFNEVANGRDGFLYGGQLQTDWKWSSKVSANFNLAYFDWNRADQVLLALGASATQVNGGISNGSGVAGGQNGSLGTTNRILRNAGGSPVGFLANFHLLDVLGNVTWQASSRFPVTFTFDYVRNMTSRINDERNGYWTGAQVGQARERGDWLFGYYFTRIEQDAVLVPFNFSDILASNSRAHMPTVSYQLSNGVTLQWTGLFSGRVNRVVQLSPFNRYLNRMQFDVIYKF
ncbi:MAG: putative porin [Acidobacteriota bacterium]